VVVEPRLSRVDDGVDAVEAGFDEGEPVGA